MMPRMKDGRTHLAHKAEIGSETGAIVVTRGEMVKTLNGRT